MDIKQINSDIQKLVTDKINRGEPVAKTWVTQEVLNNHSDVRGNDVDFYVVCARDYVYKVVKQQINKYEPKEGDSDQQMVMEGFEHLQNAYPVDRSGERVIVPIDQISDEELERRAEELELMAKGCLNHAKEIRRYIRDRNPSASANG